MAIDYKKEDETPPKQKINKIAEHLKELQPPAREQHFSSLYDSKYCRQRLEETVQHSWWLPESNRFSITPPVESQCMESNFANLYSLFISHSTFQMIPYESPRLASEENLIREILWMFCSPTNCFFFKMNSATDIEIRDNVSIPSVSVVSVI